MCIRDRYKAHPVSVHHCGLLQWFFLLSVSLPKGHRAHSLCWCLKYSYLLHELSLIHISSACAISLKSDDVKEIAQADVAFHDAIYNATGNAKLVSMLNNLREQMYRCLLYTSAACHCQRCQA